MLADFNMTHKNVINIIMQSNAVCYRYICMLTRRVYKPLHLS